MNPPADPIPLPIPTQSWVETHEEPFVVIDGDYTIVAANTAYARAYGADSSALVGRKCHVVSHRSDVPCHENGENCPHRRVFASGQPTEVDHVHFDVVGRADRVRLSARPLRMIDGHLLMTESVRRLQADDVSGAGEMIGASPAFNALLAQLADAAASDLPALLTGETGVGKELAARFIHAHSAQCAGPLVVLDCTAVPESLFEAEMFGHEKGAFTGPSARRVGLVEAAEGGTLFLDELGELPPTLQAKLLRFIEHGEFRRLGANELRRVSCRIVAATNQPLAELARAGRFRRDLYHRLAGMEILVPPLRERGDDGLLIAQALLQRLPAVQRSAGFRPESLAALRGHVFGGNVRELSHLVRRAAQRAGHGWIGPEHLDLRGAAPVMTARLRVLPTLDGLTGAEPAGAAESDEATRHSPARLASHIRSLCNCGVPRREVAQRLGVSERTVYRHLARRPTEP